MDVRYLQGFGDMRDHLKAINAYRPGIYGLSFKTAMARLGHRTMREVKARFPSMVVIAWGSHVSVMADEVMNMTLVDASFRGEEGWSGRLTSPADVRALTDAICERVTDRELARRMGERNRRVCPKNFSLSVISPDLAGIRDLITADGSAGKHTRIPHKLAGEMGRTPAPQNKKEIAS